jgi:hypothetical protein
VLRALSTVDYQEKRVQCQVGYDDPSLVEAAERLCTANDLNQWQIFNRLGQGDYIHYLKMPGHTPGHVKG